MDHKVSKDMISSGMTPSGEKTQADLGRTQYGSAPSPSKLMDAYKSMYEHHKKDADGNTIPHEGEELNEVVGMMVAQSMKKGANPKKKTTTPQLSAEDVDLFDVISTHFINEGYEEKDIYKAMSSLTGDQLQNLDEAIPLIGGALAALGKVGAGVGAKVAAAGGAKALAAKGLASAGKMATGAAKGIASAGKQGLKTLGSNVTSAARGVPSAAKQVSGNVAKNVSGAARGTVDAVKSAGRGIKGAVRATKNFYMDPSKSVADKLLATSAGMDIAGRIGSGMKPRGLQKADTDLFDIVKGQLLDEGLSEEEIKDIMLTLTPDEIVKELEESSLSAGSSGGHYSDGGDGVFRSKQQVANMFNKNIPAKRNGKVDKPTRKAINTSAKDFGIQGPSTLKQSVEPEGETI